MIYRKGARRGAQAHHCAPQTKEKPQAGKQKTNIADYAEVRIKVQRRRELIYRKTTAFTIKNVNTPKYDEPMPPYLGVFRIGSKKWQPHEFLAKFLAFADFWRRLKFARSFLLNGEFSPHIRFGGACAAPLLFLPAAHPRKVRRYILLTYSEYIISVQF